MCFLRTLHSNTNYVNTKPTHKSICVNWKLKLIQYKIYYSFCDCEAGWIELATCLTIVVCVTRVQSEASSPKRERDSSSHKANLSAGNSRKWQRNFGHVGYTPELSCHCYSKHFNHKSLMSPEVLFQPVLRSIKSI